MNLSLIIKNLLDRFFAIIMFIILIPVFLLITLFIKMDSKGNAFYKQKRLGKNGKVFDMYKFRSMYTDAKDIRNADGSTFNSEDDPRVTKIGKILRKTSLDELPQLINILIGEMSFIGPRPDLPDHYEMYSEFHKKKLLVKPGVTGLAQSIGRNSIPWGERLDYDVEYVENYTLLLDIKVLLKTFFSVLKRENIYVNNVTKATTVGDKDDIKS